MTSQLTFPVPGDSYVLLPVSETLVDVWRMNDEQREHFSSTGEPKGAFLVARVHGDKLSRYLIGAGYHVYFAFARFDPDYITPWGRWRFRKRGRKDYRGLWSFTSVVDVWIHTEEGHRTERRRVAPCFGCWDRNSRMRPTVIIDSVDVRRVTT